MDEAMEDIKVFTEMQANQLIPTLSELLYRLKQKQKEAVNIETQIDALELIVDNQSKKTVRELEQLIKRHHSCVTEFYEIIDQTHAHGCLVKDIDLGLIDFYAVVDSKVVYLCWKLGEKRVSYWHEVGQGYLNRRPLNHRRRN